MLNTIEQAEARAQLHRPTAAVTDKGQAVRLLYRLVHALGVLPEDDRQAIISLFTEETAELPIACLLDS